MTEWTAVLHRLATADTAEAHADSTEQHYLTLARQYPDPRPLGIAHQLTEVRDAAILARADAYRDNRGLPDDEGARDEMHSRARAAISVLTDRQRAAATDDNNEPARLTENLIDGADHLRSTRSRLDQVAAEVTRRGLTAPADPGPPAAGGPAAAVIDDEYWRRAQAAQRQASRQSAEYRSGR